MNNDQYAVVYPGVNYTFGTGETPVFNETTPDFGDLTIRTADSERPRADGVLFGTDFRGGRTITFELGVQGATEQIIRDAEAELSRVWRADSVRLSPGAVAELRIQYRGNERVVFGRPRRYSANLSNAKFGLGRVTADFACSDDKYYSVQTFQTGVNLVPAPGGGLMAPLASPLSTTRTSDRSTAFVVNSELPVTPVIVIEGPITNPIVEVVGVFKLEFRTSLGYDQLMTIDTQPWGLRVLIDGGSRAGTLTRASTRLSKVAIPSGTHELVLRGTDETGTANVNIAWRNVYASP